MKKTFNVAIGSRSFIIDEDAYYSLSSYLESFKQGLSEPGKAEVMEELEMRIADLFKERLKGREVVDITITNEIIEQLGMPNWKADFSDEDSDWVHDSDSTGVRRFYRDLDDNILGGVCSGLALYLRLEATGIRLIFFIALFCGTAGFWIYVLLWLLVRPARTAAQKCELRGIPATAENIRKFSRQNRYE